MKRALMVLLVVVLIAGVVIVPGCAKKAAEEKTLKVGVVAPMTGDVKTFGDSTKAGFDLALEEAGGKAGDYTIVPVYADDRNDPTESANVATKLITQDGVKAIIGSVASKCSIAVSEIAQANKVVQITSTSTNPRVTVDPQAGGRKDYVFRACFIDPFQGKIAAKFALETLGAKKAAVMYDQGNDYTIGLANFFKDNFEAGGGQVVAFEAYSKDDADFSAQLTKIAGLGIDLLYLPDYYNKVSLIGQQARDKGITAPFMGGDGWDSPDLDYNVMQGGYFTNHYSPDDPSETVQAFVTAYKAKYGATPDALAALAYDATKLLLKAIETANSDDPTAIRDALKGLSLQVVSGNISFDANGDPTKAAVIMQVTFENGVKGYKYVATVNP